MLEFINNNLNYSLLALIILGGIFVTKYSKEVLIKDTYKVLIASMFFSTIFYFVDGCGQKCMSSYLFTYLFSTSFYELLVKSLLKKLNNLQ